MKKAVYIDTNIILRFLVRDIESQYKEAEGIFEKIEKEEIMGYLSILVVNEIIWIAENFYEYKRTDYIPFLRKLIALKNIKIVEVKKKIILEILLKMQSTKIDFTDLYLLEIAGKDKIVSFDKDLKR